jgi:DNA-binding transcriptional LysR family regulator
MQHSLVLCDPQVCDGCHQQRENLFRSAGVQPSVAEYVSTHSLMLALVAAGYGVGFTSAAHLEGCTQADVVMRPLAEHNASLTTYLLRLQGEVLEPLRQFIDRAERVAGTSIDGDRRA